VVKRDVNEGGRRERETRGRRKKFCFCPDSATITRKLRGRSIHEPIQINSQYQHVNSESLLLTLSWRAQTSKQTTRYWGDDRGGGVDPGSSHDGTVLMNAVLEGHNMRLEIMIPGAVRPQRDRGA